MILLDIDHFKEINDRFGHPAGDSVLVDAGQTLQSLARNIDIVARIGGEEFALILPNTLIEGAEALAERLLKQFRESSTTLDDEAVRITVSAGVSALPDCEAETQGQLLECADRALYASKKSGRDCWSRCVPRSRGGSAG